MIDRINTAQRRHAHTGFASLAQRSVTPKHLGFFAHAWQRFSFSVVFFNSPRIPRPLGCCLVPTCDREPNHPIAPCNRWFSAKVAR